MLAWLFFDACAVLLHEQGAELFFLIGAELAAFLETADLAVDMVLSEAIQGVVEHLLGIVRVDHRLEVRDLIELVDQPGILVVALPVDKQGAEACVGVVAQVADQFAQQLVGAVGRLSKKLECLALAG